MSTPNFYNIAVGEIGVHEIEGSASSPRVLEYQTAAGYNAKQDDVAWCASFVSWVMKQAGIPYRFETSAQAADWAKWGKAVLKPVVGAVMVFPHHVGFFAGWVDKVGGSWRLLSGNSGGTAHFGGEVRISVYNSMANVIAMRIPEAMAKPVEIKKVANTPSVIGSGVSVTAVVAAVANNPDVVTDNLQKFQEKFAQGNIIGLVCALVFLVAVGWIIYAEVKKNMADKNLARPSSN